MHLSIEQRRTEIAMICRRYDVRRLEVFGSAARGADFDPLKSDADFLVDFKSEKDLHPLTQFFGLASDLEILLGRKIDLVESGTINNPFILASIDRAREIVYAS